MARVNILRVEQDEGEDPRYWITVYCEGTDDIWNFDVKPCESIDKNAIELALLSREQADNIGRTW